MNRLIQSTLAIFMSMGFINTHAQCEADTTVYLTDYHIHAKRIHHLCGPNSRLRKRGRHAQC